MNRIFFLIAILISLPNFCETSLAQTLTQDTTKVKKDTVCYKLSFQRGDTLTYDVNSIDSIVINYGEPLIKSRNELLEVVCDSVSDSNTFYLTIELLDFIGFESSGDVKNQEHKETPWKDRKVWIEIDTLGNRLSWDVDDSTQGAMSTGGAFQPYLFFPFKESCKAINETWLVNTTDDIPENGIPVPVLRQSSLFRSRKDIDTLGELCHSFEFIKTGQGTIGIPEENHLLKVTSVINGFGIYDISITKKIPIYFYYTVEQKLTVHTSETETQPGWHYIIANFTLNQFKHIDPNVLFKKQPVNKPKPETEKRKIKHR